MPQNGKLDQSMNSNPEMQELIKTLESSDSHDRLMIMSLLRTEEKTN